MRLAVALFWLAMACMASFAGLDATVPGLFFVIGVALVVSGRLRAQPPARRRLAARGGRFRGMVGAITFGQFGAPLIVVLLRDTALVAFALATMLRAHVLPFGSLYRASA